MFELLAITTSLVLLQLLVVLVLGCGKKSKPGGDAAGTINPKDKTALEAAKSEKKDQANSKSGAVPPIPTSEKETKVKSTKAKTAPKEEVKAPYKAPAKSAKEPAKELPKLPEPQKEAPKEPEPSPASKVPDNEAPAEAKQTKDAKEPAVEPAKDTEPAKTQATLQTEDPKDATAATAKEGDATPTQLLAAQPTLALGTEKAPETGADEVPKQVDGLQIEGSNMKSLALMTEKQAEGGKEEAKDEKKEGLLAKAKSRQSQVKVKAA